MKNKLLLSLIASSCILSADINIKDQNKLGYSIQVQSALKSYEHKSKEYYSNMDDELKKECVLYPIKKYIAVRCFIGETKNDLKDKLNHLKSQGIAGYIYKTKYNKFLELKSANQNQISNQDDYFDEEDEVTATKKVEVVSQDISSQRKDAHSKLQNSLNSSTKLSYTIQLLSVHKLSLKSLKVQYNLLPKDIKENSVIYPIGQFIAIRYLSYDNISDLKPILKELRKGQFKDSIIVKANKKKFKRLLNKDTNTQPRNPNGYQLACVSKQSFEFQKLDNFQYTKTLLDAHKFKNKNKILDSIKMYEKVFSHDQTDRSINNNLFYLYGKTNNWPKAMEKVCLIKKPGKVLYSYAIGALEINNPMIEDDLIGILKYDDTGYIHLALGVFMERNESYKKAHDYFKKAYDINRYDLYLAYAYARSCEIENDYKKAAFIYKIIAQNGEDRFQNIKKNAYERYNQISKLLQMEDER